MNDDLVRQVVDNMAEGPRPGREGIEAHRSSLDGRFVNSPPTFLAASNLARHGWTHPNITRAPPGSVHQPGTICRLPSAKLVERVKVVWTLEILFDENLALPGRG